MQLFICPDIKVKPCPCCGKEGVLWSSTPDMENSDGEYPVLFWVQCTREDCGIRTLDSASAQECIDIWDRRRNRCDCKNGKHRKPEKTTGGNMVRVSHEAYQLFLKKNADYGDSFSRCGVSGIMVRLLDKLSRAVVVSRNAVEIRTESLRDSLLDISNYALMGVVLLDGAEPHKPNISRKRKYVSPSSCGRAKNAGRI